MERLTHIDSKGWYVDDISVPYDERHRGMEIDRLAAYEDTGLTPEEIERILDAYGRSMTLRTENADRLRLVKDISADRLKKIAEAEQDGRLVELPCKVGDTVYRVVGLCSWPEAECPEESFSCSMCRESRKVIIEVNIESIEGAVSVCKCFGETVFATRQEAEAAVSKMPK